MTSYELQEFFGMKGGVEWLQTWEGMQWSFRIAAGLLMFCAHTVYGKVILMTDWSKEPKDSRPSKGTWFTWAAMDMTILVFMLMEGTATSMVAVDGTINVIIFLIALWVGTNSWTVVEKGCVCITLVGIALYVTLGNTAPGLLCACVATTSGVIPTWLKERSTPGGEDKTAWMLWMASCVCGVIGIPGLLEPSKWTVANVAQPLAFTIVCGSMTLLLFILNPLFPLSRDERASVEG